MKQFGSLEVLIESPAFIVSRIVASSWSITTTYFAGREERPPSLKSLGTGLSDVVRETRCLPFVSLHCALIDARNRKNVRLETLCDNSDGNLSSSFSLKAVSRSRGS
jgi:hypothetical protein